MKPDLTPDLTLLYSELGLRPNCSLAELQLAYRRRISELQPNRSGGVQSPESVAMLRNLIWLYTSATRFHRRYGRLPGAAPGSFMATPVRSHYPVVSRTPAERAAPAAPDSRPPPRIAFWVAVLLLVLLFVLLAVASGEWLR
ncbi:hypothetical protein [Lysobacter solisilvae (ex Woo and Kim 2020)]|uniref:J domain-containing protein n=1 Tax=Agrilutibacter terrestris TaxID=2865112 RepID=A0A7H0FXB6_9GAMM|nr:hypothetical protein [Lysobacter terrestris]QNP40682.1 hypothetical protein H8B22_14685 [Lysobacter terrestris]